MANDDEVFLPCIAGSRRLRKSERFRLELVNFLFLTRFKLFLPYHVCITTAITTTAFD